MSHVGEIKELNALVSLMDEPNEIMFSEIRNKVMSFGKLAIPILEEAWVNTMADHDSERIKNLINEIRQKEFVLDFNAWIKNSNKNLIEGLILLTRYLNPDFDEDYYTAQFEKLVRETWLEINDSLTALEKIKVVNHVIYGVYKFSGQIGPTVKSETYFISKVFDYKMGNSLSMGILYIAVAQSLNIPVFGVNLQGHFILAYMDDLNDIRLPDKYSESDILFYINPVNKGAIFTRNEINNFIVQMKIATKPEFFLPCTNQVVIRRMISELIISFEKENNHSKTETLNRLLSFMTKTTKE
jgi:regulator of sirC expression with transglutaminase-like and TPR domain